MERHHQIHTQQVWFIIGATKVHAGILLNNCRLYVGAGIGYRLAGTHLFYRLYEG
jgi:hypothetical protein